MQKTADWFRMAMPITKISKPRTATRIMWAKTSCAVASFRRKHSFIVMAMRMTFILLLVAFLQVSANGFAQTVTFSGKNIPLQQVFTAIKQQTGFAVFGNNELFQHAKTISIQADKMPLHNFLDKVFEAQPLTYHIDGKTIFIHSKTPIPSNKVVAEPAATTVEQGFEITGRIYNTRNEPLPYASVQVKGTKLGALTDTKGAFVLKNVKVGDVLVVSYIGCITKEATITEDKEYFFQLADTKNQLDQVIIQGYGTTTKRSSTGNIAKVTGEEIARQNVMNPLMALQGKVPGLVITPTTGYSSGTMRVELRGRKTISDAFVSDPLYIIDGVPITTLELSGANYQSGSAGVLQAGFGGVGGGQSPFFSLDPTEIESIEVLKDADATAIYGSRGASGVILITTKRANLKSGSGFTANIQTGMRTVTRYMKMMSTQDFLQMRKQAFANDGMTPNADNAPDLMMWDSTRNVNWQKELYGNRGKSTQANVAFTGGNQIAQFRVSGQYSKEVDILSAKGANERAGVAMNVNHTSYNNKFRMNMGVNYSLTKTDSRPNPDAVNYAPNAPSIYNEVGALNFAAWPASINQTSFPFYTLEMMSEARTVFLKADMTADYNLMKGLNVKANIGYNSFNTDHFYGFPMRAQNPLYNPTGMAMTGYTNITNVVIEPQITYRRYFGKSNLQVLFGASYQSNVTKGINTIGMGFSSDDFIESVNMAQMQMATPVFGQYKYAAMFGRISYDYDNKYFLNLNGRRDGSSRFGKDNQFGNFGSVGLAWIATEEPWVKSFLPKAISMIKLRSSYGLTGSDNVGDYKYLSQWTSTVGSYQLYPYDTKTPLVNLLAVNPNYRWQVNKKFEAALSLGFLQDKLSADFIYYNERCNNQLTSFPTGIYTGFNSVVANWPANIENKGFDVLVNATLMDRDQFRWSAYFNINFNTNKLLAYPGFENSPYYAKLKIGKSLNELYLLKYTGVDPKTGEYSFQLKDKNLLTIDQSIPAGTGADDRISSIDLSPKYSGGFGSSVTWKNWDMHVAFNYRRQYQVNAYFPMNTAGAGNNLPAEMVGNVWEKEGDIKKYAKYHATEQPMYANFRVSDGYYFDTKFVRLNNVAIGYKMPGSLMKQTKLKSCRLFVQLQNMFVLTNYNGIDPEITSMTALPPAKSFTAGINLQF
ncbi:TonB-linked SusC/RagA family outer membrane protein [Chitinophaga skermanii]|uniref:TonB-linked SusC/RagA family outer membrane protein n=1 Tax=Chitinophaga skermanii TaxID=331697 RepID=A0A327QVX4_9BACT|nr:SusC/RagA family TonB-linked outer membrane protein [Chitinophaga skermanii]RAJ08749.1 TonB-linked SusC/RagA family outer membrane protein [Chitinophaga skermanii]